MITEAWIIFLSGPDDYWSKKWVKKGFSHICVLGRDKYNWFFFNFDERMMGFKILNYERDVDIVARYKNKSDKVIYIKFDQIRSVDYKKGMGFMLWRPFTCVELVKYFIGFKCFAWTPWQLYKKLVKASKTKRPNHIFEIKNLTKGG